MPRYFLHIDDMETDPEGTELADVAAARHEAELSARELAGVIKSGKGNVPLRILIADSDGQVLDTVHTRDILPVELRGSD